MKNTKPWYLSKTLWINLLIGLMPLIIENFVLIKNVLPNGIYGIIIFFLVIVNFVLRFSTTQGLSSK